MGDSEAPAQEEPASQGSEVGILYLHGKYMTKKVFRIDRVYDAWL
jgi:hypothetical protein